MKKAIRITGLILCLILVFAVAGCRAEKGDTGKSAYEIWLSNGYSGTETDFLEWLRGNRGDPGPSGKSAYELAVENGFEGSLQDWLNGLKGKSAYGIWLDEGHSGTEAVFLEWLREGGSGDMPRIGENGNWWIGETDTGVRADGLSAYEIYLKYYEYDGDERQWIEDLANGRLDPEEKKMSMAEFMDDETIIVMTNRIWGEGWAESGYTSGSPVNKVFVPEDFASINATKIFWINKADLGPEFAMFEYMLAIKIADKGEENVNAAVKEVEKLDFIDYAWVNLYDYKSNPAPSEEKSIWYGSINENFTDGTIMVSIDKSFVHRLFTLEDFPMINAVSARWVNPAAYNNNFSESYRLSYAIMIGERGKQNVIDAIRELEKVDFIRRAGPNYITSID